MVTMRYQIFTGLIYCTLLSTSASAGLIGAGEQPANEAPLPDIEFQVYPEYDIALIKFWEDRAEQIAREAATQIELDPDQALPNWEAVHFVPQIMKLDHPDNNRVLFASAVLGKSMVDRLIRLHVDLLFLEGNGGIAFSVGDNSDYLIEQKYWAKGHGKIGKLLHAINHEFTELAPYRNFAANLFGQENALRYSASALLGRYAHFYHEIFTEGKVKPENVKQLRNTFNNVVVGVIANFSYEIKAVIKIMSDKNLTPEKKIELAKILNFYVENKGKLVAISSTPCNAALANKVELPDI